MTDKKPAAAEHYWLTRQEAADWLRISLVTLLARLAAGELVDYRVGTTGNIYRLRRDEVEAAMEAQSSLNRANVSEPRVDGVAFSLPPVKQKKAVAQKKNVAPAKKAAPA